jgi:hypothetical protein
MSEVPMPLPEDDLPPPDAFEAELVAYLDGELEPAAARKVEARLAADDAARTKADELKKTFDLLDYLPKSEPSPNFTTRTLEKIPALPATKPAGSQPVARTRTQSQPAPIDSNPNVPTPGASPAARSASRPMELTQRTLPLPIQRRASAAVWAAMVLVAVSACGAIGYFAALMFHAPRSTSDPNALLEELAAADQSVVEHLPLYAAIDDFDYLHELASPDFFGDEPAVAYEWKVPSLEPDKPSAEAFEKLSRAFKALPAARQQALRDLHKQLFAQEAVARERLFRVLEAHAIWLERLSDAERKGVFAAATSRYRLDEIRRIRNEQWVESLPVSLRTELHKLPQEQQNDRIQKWKDEEAIHRAEWAFVRQHAPDILDNKAPWPFDNTMRQKEVIEFMRVSFRPDDDKKCRFTANELGLYKASLSAAEKVGGWLAWGAYGKVSYDLTRKYDKYLLPEAATGEPITTYSQLGPTVARLFDKDKGPGHSATNSLVGKWPDFALAVHDFAMNKKGEKIPLGALGPAKPADFKEPLKSFVTKDLYSTLNPMEKKDILALEGHWPKYPQELVRLARQHDLCVPGMMLPGPPKHWDQIYGFGFGFGRTPFGPKP